MFEHKGDTGRIDSADVDTGWFLRQCRRHPDVVTFEGKPYPNLESIRDSVEDYFGFLQEAEGSPGKALFRKVCGAFVAGTASSRFRRRLPGRSQLE